MLLQQAADAMETAGHPLAGTVAEYMWLLPLLPLLGFVLNGLLSLLSAYRAGPADPGLSHGDAHVVVAGHDAHAVDAHAHDTNAGGAHGDDHHPVVRHR